MFMFAHITKRKVTELIHIVLDFITILNGLRIVFMNQVFVDFAIKQAVNFYETRGIEV